MNARSSNCHPERSEGSAFTRFFAALRMTGKKSGIIFLTLSFLSTSCVSVQLNPVKIEDGSAAEKLTWEGIAHEALQNNPDLEEARYQLKSVARSRDSALGDFLPSVDAVAGRTRTRPRAAGESVDSQDFSVGVSQPLFTGFGTTAEYLRALKNWQAAQFAYDSASANVRFLLRSTFVDVLRQKELLSVQERILERRRRNTELISLRYDAGREHQGSLMRTQAILSQADFDTRQTGRRIETQSILLGKQMGGKFLTPFPIEGNLKEMLFMVSQEKPDFVTIANETPEVKNLVKVAEALKAAIKTAESNLYPQATGSYSYGYSGERSSNLRDSAELDLSVSVPLFEGGKNIAAIRKAKADFHAAFQRARSARDQKVADLADVWASLQNAKELVKVRQNFLEASRKRAEIVKTQYETGLINFQDFDTAEQELADSERNYIQSLGDALSQEATWDLERGALLEEVVRAK